MIKTRTLSEIAFAISTDLLRSQRQATGRTSHVERHPERGKQALCLARHAPPIGHRAAVGMADEDVLGDVQVGKQQRFLVDRRNPGRWRSRGVETSPASRRA